MNNLEVNDKETDAKVPPVWFNLAVWMSNHILLTLLGYSVVLILLYEYFMNYFLPFFGI